MVDVKRGRELEAAATPGEWHATHHEGIGYRVWKEHPSPTPDYATVTITDGQWNEADGDLIVWLRNNCTALLDAAERVEALEAENALMLESTERHGAGRCDCAHAPCRHDASRFLAERETENRRANELEAERNGWKLRAEAAERRVAELEAENASAKDSAHKYYVKARVYGAIAAKFNEVLTAIVAVGDGVGAVALARGALSWTHSDRNGVPFAAVEEVGKLLAAERARDEWRRKYYAVADAVTAESTGVEDLCNQARRTRRERDEAVKERDRRNRALQRIVDIANGGGATELTMDCARIALEALGEIADARVGEGVIDGLRSERDEAVRRAEAAEAREKGWVR